MGFLFRVIRKYAVAVANSGSLIFYNVAVLGWDYSGRYCKSSTFNTTDNSESLLTYGIKAIAPVDLTSLMAGNHALVSVLFH